MSVDYSKQYRPGQLEPFFPNELIKMLVSMLVTLAAIVALALLVPEGEEIPADPRSTPAHIKPEWYFLAVYQSLKLTPQSLFGISGKFLGVLMQVVLFTVLIAVPFWYRRVGPRSPGLSFLITLSLAAFAVLTVWGIWPSDSNDKLLPVQAFLDEHWLFVVMLVLMLVAFWLFMAWEKHVIRRDWHG